MPITACKNQNTIVRPFARCNGTTENAAVVTVSKTKILHGRKGDLWTGKKPRRNQKPKPLSPSVTVRVFHDEKTDNDRAVGISRSLSAETVTFEKPTESKKRFKKERTTREIHKMKKPT